MICFTISKDNFKTVSTFVAEIKLSSLASLICEFKDFAIESSFVSGNDQRSVTVNLPRGEFIIKPILEAFSKMFISENIKI